MSALRTLNHLSGYRATTHPHLNASALDEITSKTFPFAHGLLALSFETRISCFVGSRRVAGIPATRSQSIGTWINPKNKVLWHDVTRQWELPRPVHINGGSHVGSPPKEEGDALSHRSHLAA